MCYLVNTKTVCENIVKYVGLNSMLSSQDI
jgi:hypothetical protein